MVTKIILYIDIYIYTNNIILLRKIIIHVYKISFIK
jgi:hypothetical protein